MSEWTILLAEVTKQAPEIARRLSPLNQIRVIVGLFVVIVLGLVIFIVIKAGSHMVKGLSAAAKRLPSNSAPDEDDWARKPLNPPTNE